MAYAVHDDVGRIIQTVEGEVDATFEERVEGLGYRAATVPLPDILGRPLSLIYVLDGAITDRPPITASTSKTEIAADGEDVKIISGLPVPCEVTIAGTVHTVEDGTIELRTTMPGDYRLTIDHWPYLPWSLTVSAR